MSTRIDVLKELIDTTAHLYACDLKALPDGKFATSPMGVARTPQDISTEVAGFNRMCCKLLTNQAPDESKGEMISDAEAASEEVQASAAELSSTVASLDPEAFDEMVMAPWGQEISKYGLAQMAALNTIYHDGQLNYFQALHGDGEMHWGH
jgi:hypothetical protein